MQSTRLLVHHRHHFAEGTSAIGPVDPVLQNVFDDDFWGGLDVVVNALDNVSARLYVDSRCVYFGRPLLESGTLGAKANTQVVVPNITENYGARLLQPRLDHKACRRKVAGLHKRLLFGQSAWRHGWLDQQTARPTTGASRDPPEKQAPMCTLHSFPHNIDHCLTFARSEFEGLLEKSPAEANAFLLDPQKCAKTLVPAVIYRVSSAALL